VIGQLVAQAQSEALLVRPGSDLAAALEEALTLLSIDDRAESQVIVLVSDGEHEGRDLEFAIRRASDAGVRVFTVGAGTENGTAIPSDSEGTATESTRLERDVLERIAAETGGAYRSVGEAPGLAVEFARLRSSELASGERAAPVERFRWFVAGAIGLLALHALLGETAGSRLRPRRDRRMALGGALVGALLIGACSGTVAYEHVRSGNEAHAEGRYEDALAEYQVAAGAEPENPAIPYNTGNTLHQLERYEEAQVASEQSARTATEERLFIDATYALGNTAVRRGDLEAARTHYREVLLRDPADEDARHNLELVMLALQEQQPPSDQPGDQGEGPGGDGQGPQADGGTDPGATPGPGDGGPPGDQPTPEGGGGDGGSDGSSGDSPPPTGPGDGPELGEPGGEGGSQDGQPGPSLSPEELQAQLEAALAGLDREVSLEEALQILELLRERNALDSLGQEPDRGPLPAR
jgi:Ca-activated chloride channel family protein